MPPFNADASVITSPLLLLDGGYCLTTSLSVDELAKESVHVRYTDLAMVENAFRTCKTSQLELRPVYVRKQDRTRGHVFVVMLSYLLIQKLREYWNTLDMTVEEGIDLLAWATESLCCFFIRLARMRFCRKIYVYSCLGGKCKTRFFLKNNHDETYFYYRRRC
ncbi:MAG: transposase [Planctomycetaceae bacterium]|nr:transposase [Planctomycetaceae bacterium]